MQNFDLLGNCNEDKTAKKCRRDLNYELIKCSWNGFQILCGDQTLSSLISALNMTKFSLWDLGTVASRTHCNQNWKHVVKSPLNMFLVGKCAVSRHFRDNVWEEWAEISHIHCSGSLEPEYSCHNRDWIMELPMEADILTFTGILTPEDASVASCSPLISRSA